MTEREKLANKIAKISNKVAFWSQSYLIADFIIEDRKRICEPLSKLGQMNMIKWPEKKSPIEPRRTSFYTYEYCTGYNNAIDACKAAYEQEKKEHDISVHGQYIEKDGKRIDPKDFYKQEPSAPTVEEIANILRKPFKNTENNFQEPDMVRALEIHSLLTREKHD